MKYFRHHCFHVLGFWILLGCGLGSVNVSFGQIPGLAAKNEGSNAPKAETREQAAERYAQWRVEASAMLVRLESSAAPSSISQAESDLRRRNLEQLVLLLNRVIKNEVALDDARKKLEDSKATAKGWAGFSEAPPYSLFLVDELVNEQYATRASLKSSRASLNNFERLLSNILAEAKAVEAQVNSSINAVKEAKGEDASAKWRLDAALEAQRLLGIRVRVAEINCEIQRERIAALEVDLGLVERKLAAAKAQSSLTDADITRIRQLSDERRLGFEKDMEALGRRLKVAVAARDKSLKEATDLSHSSAEVTEQARDAEELGKFRARVAEERVDALQSVIECFEGLVQMENLLVKLYETRKQLIEAKSAQARAEQVNAISQIRDRHQAWSSVLSSEIADMSADLSKLESRASTIGAEDATFPLINEQRAAKSEKLASLQRLSKAVILQRRLVSRWLEEYGESSEPQDLLGMTKNVGLRSWNWAKRVWAFEVMTFENKVEIDGFVRVAKSPVTLGMLVTALSFFILGYFVIARILDRIQSGMVNRRHLGHAQAKTLRNWSMLVAGFFLLLGAFSVLNIPLTAFAFLGGALAIGLGFGTQTLIKNFICGIIVLFERKIRVGDLLEVDGFVGRVSEINTRSSILRNIDDMETLVPNSLFLESRVTNWTLSNSRIRRSVRVGVAYGTSPSAVMEVLNDAASRHGLICKDPAPYVVFDDFGESALIFQLYYWLDLGGPANGAVVASDLRLIIEKRFNELGIGVPFPQRDLRLSSEQPLEIHLARDVKS